MFPLEASCYKNPNKICGMQMMINGKLPEGLNPEALVSLQEELSDLQSFLTAWGRPIPGICPACPDNITIISLKT